jgi:regulatory protein
VLRRKEIPDEVAEQVLDRLTAVGLIDDEAYAAAFVATKHRDRGLGRSALRTELQRKGVDAQTAAAAVAAGPDAARRRLVGLLARRGYSPSLAMAVVDEALTRYSAEEC